jgi:hypothetical protein
MHPGTAHEGCFAFAFVTMGCRVQFANGAFGTPHRLRCVRRGWNRSSPFTTLPIAHLEQATGGRQSNLINSGQLPPHLSPSFSTFSPTTVTTTQLNQSLNQINQQSWDGSMMVGPCTIPLNGTSLIASLDSQQAQYHDQVTNRPHEAEWSHE